MTAQENDVMTLVVRAEGLGTEDIVNVFELQKTDAVVADDASVVSDLEDWITLVFDLVKVLQVVTTLYREFKVYNKTQGVIVGSGTITSPAAGTSAGGSLPLGVAGLISFPTNIGKITGRKYVGGLGATHLTADGTMVSTSVTQMVAIGNAIRAAFAGTTSGWKYGVTQASTGNFITPNATLVTDVFAYQRRRKAGRGS
jgi:hypothetical protein